MALLAVFGALTALTLWSTWRDSELRWVGLWLAASFIVSNILHAKMHVMSLPGPYSMLELMVLIAAAIAWDARRTHWPLVLLAGISVFSICANVAFAAEYRPGPQQIYVFELTTNLCFVAECLLASVTGLADGFRTGRFRRLSRLRGRNMAANAAIPGKDGE